MKEQLALLPGYLTAHLQLVLVSLVFGVVISVPLGIAVSRRKRLESAVLGVASVVQTIPGLALLAFMVPVLAWTGQRLAGRLGVDLPSIGFLPAVIALTIYSLLPILRNTVTGLSGVEPAVIEAARAVGMTPRQRLFQVELPMALPVIAAGLRTATVWVVGTATLSTPVGAPSLGNYIFSGLQTRNYDSVLVGCLAAAGLALSLDFLVRTLEVGLDRRDRRLLGLTGVALVALFAYAVGTLVADSREERQARPVVIGAKTFTEQYILAEILAGQIERRTSRPVRVASSLGSTVAFDALAAGEIDAYVDYSGTIWATILGRQGERVPKARVLETVREELPAEHGVRVAAVLGFENAYALAMRSAHARELGVTSISDLAPHAAGLTLGSDYEFLSRAEWRALESTYGLSFAEARSMDPSLMYEAAANGSVDVISAFSTDGRIAAFDLAVLADEVGVIPPYDAILLVGGRISEDLPDVAGALAELEGTIDAAAMRRMNLAVDREARLPAEVAEEFLHSLP